MSGARTNTLATLRGSIERIEAHGDGACAQAACALGHAEADAALQGGLALGAMHEVFAEGTAERGGDRLYRGPCRDAWPRGGRWSGCGRILPRSNRARCR